MGKLLVDEENKVYLLKSEDKDFHINHGMIKSEDIISAKSGDLLKTNKGVPVKVLEASFLDYYKKIKRGSQIIMRKDIGLIITETGITKDSVVIESGAGSGATGTFLSQICKKVYSYEIRKDFFKTTKENMEYLGIKNMIVKNQDAKKGYDEKDVNVVLLDVPDPWEFVVHAKNALKIGGYVVSYSPCITQTMQFVKSLGSDFLHLKTCEIIEREWNVKEKRVRPKSRILGHTAFLSFARKT